MRYSIIWVIVLILCLCTGAYAMNFFNPPENNALAPEPEVAEQWKLPPKGATALGKLYAEDLVTIGSIYDYLLTGDESKKSIIITMQADTDRSAHGSMDALEYAIGERTDALSDLNLIYDAWGAMNLTVPRVVSSFETNGSSFPDNLASFENEAINLTDNFETYSGRYYDIRTSDEETLRLFMFIDLLAGINAEKAYEKTGNSLHKMIYITRMIGFDQKTEQYIMQFPDISIKPMKDLKTPFDTAVAQKFEVLGVNGTLSQDEIDAVETAVLRIMTGYQDLNNSL